MIPSLFSGTFFNRRKMMFETGSLQTTLSNIFYFLPSTTDRGEEKNSYLESVNFSLIDVPVSSFETKENIGFDSSKHDLDSQEKEIMAVDVVKMLKKVADMFNANLVKNADGLLFKRDPNVSVEWIRKNKSRLPQNRYKMSY